METLETPALGEGVTETKPGQVQVPRSPYRSRVLPEEELKRLGIIKAGDGRYYRASEGPGGSIVLRPVDPSVAAAAARTSLDVSTATSEAATEKHKLHARAVGLPPLGVTRKSMYPRAQWFCYPVTYYIRDMYSRSFLNYTTYYPCKCASVIIGCE